MVKGTSRRVIVVDSPDTDLFEQAIFIVRNDAMDRGGVTAQQLVDEACRGAEIEQILRDSHKIKPDGTDDFEVRTQQEMLEMMNSMTGTITTVLIAIALISLLVGCIGIMNIMYVTVTERTKEIGLRMSIGAKNAAILMQVLTESIILSLIGGIIGLLLGVGLSYIVSLFMSLPFVVNAVWMVISFVSCAILGLIAGFFPALKASQTDPINALRYE